MLASLLNKYNIQHNINSLPPPKDPKTESPLMMKLENTQCMRNSGGEPFGDPSFANTVFPYVR